MVRAEYLPENEDPYEQVCLRHLLTLGGVIQDDKLYSVQLMIGEFDRQDWREDLQDDIEYAIAELWYYNKPKNVQLLLYGDLRRGRDDAWREPGGASRRWTRTRRQRSSSGACTSGCPTPTCDAFHLQPNPPTALGRPPAAGPPAR